MSTGIKFFWNYGLVFILILCLQGVGAQSITDYQGDLLRHGTLSFKDVVSGHYNLTDNSEGKNYRYAISLFGNDLEYIGQKVYKSEEPLVFEHLSYNGEHLGVTFWPESNPSVYYVDILGKTGERLNRKEIDVPYQKNLNLFLEPVPGGFISGVQSLVEKNKKLLPVYRVQLKRINADSTKAGWERTYDGSDKDGQGSMHLTNLWSNDSMMVFPLVGIIKPTRESYPTGKYWLICLDVRSGNKRYSVAHNRYLTLSDVPNYLTGALQSNGDLVVVHSKVTKYKDVHWETLGFSRYSATGELIKSHTIKGKEYFKEELGELEGKKEVAVRFHRTNAKVSKTGIVTLAVEASNEEKVRYEVAPLVVFSNAYVLVYSPDFTLLEKTKVVKPLFGIARHKVRPFDGKVFYGRIRKKIKKGKAKKLKIEDLQILHDGPYAFMLADAGDDRLTTFFAERTFSNEGVEYHGIRAVTFIDGEFVSEMISLEGNPDLITLGRAKEGFVKILEYDYEQGLKDIRLERLSY